jgi:formylglycine-generating enzyme required for sulfatase activity
MRPLAFLLVVLLIVCASTRGADSPAPVTNSISQKLVWIKPGKFMMGSPAAETARSGYGTTWRLEDQREVEIKRGFWLSCYETTQSEYERIMGTNPSAFAPMGFFRGKVAGLDTRQFPAEAITFLQAEEFCRKLSDLPAERQARRTYRLPTEAEWEYACRAGSTTAFHSGDYADGADFNCCGRVTHKDLQTPYLSNPKGIWLQRTTVVGAYPANAWGLYDMHGNVAEWTSTPFRYEQHSNIDRRYIPDKNGDMRATRGGDFDAPAHHCRSARRFFHKIDTSVLGHIGFRIVMEIADKK